MNYLVDVNVWVAFALVGHVHHAVARTWFEAPDEDDSGGTRLLFCRVTQSGFLRLLTSRRIMGVNTLNAEGAWRFYDSLLADERVRFASEPVELEAIWRETARRHNRGPNFWTDAYLAAFAATAGFTVVTFDRGFRHHRNIPVRLLTADA
jgi:toxin-antitoxin system PIN domain toxin